jgi:hypothetical protein
MKHRQRARPTGRWLQIVGSLRSLWLEEAEAAAAGTASGGHSSPGAGETAAVHLNFISRRLDISHIPVYRNI